MQELKITIKKYFLWKSIFRLKFKLTTAATLRHWTMANLFPLIIVGFNVHSSVHRQYILRVQPTRCNVSQYIYSCKTLYMFQTLFPSIIRSSKLHIQRQDRYCYLLLAWTGWSSWWWMGKPSETCTASYRNKYIEKHCILFGCTLLIVGLFIE